MFSIIIGFILIVLSGLFEAIMDKLQFHFYKSIFILKENQQFWNPELSWKNKYKEDLITEKFIGSKTIFVFLTDAWHIFKMLRTITLFISISIISYNCDTPIELIIYVSICRILFGISFTLFFSKILNRR